MTEHLLVFWILFILGMHWIGDFLLQKAEWKQNKGKDIGALHLHVSTYSIVLLAIALFYVAKHGWLSSLWFWLAVNIPAHWATDYVTSRFTAPLFRNANELRHIGKANDNLDESIMVRQAVERESVGFNIIGMDQLIHQVTLIGTWWWLVL